MEVFKFEGYGCGLCQVGLPCEAGSPESLGARRVTAPTAAFGLSQTPEDRTSGELLRFDIFNEFHDQFSALDFGHGVHPEEFFPRFDGIFPVV